MKIASSIAIVLLLFVASACHTTRDAARSEIDFDLNKIEQTGHLVIRSPKDSELIDLKFSKTGTNYMLSIGKYRAIVSEAAVEAARAEVDARHMTYAGMMRLMEFMADKAGATRGLPQTFQQEQPKTIVVVTNASEFLSVLGGGATNGAR